MTASMFLFGVVLFRATLVFSLFTLLCTVASAFFPRWRILRDFAAAAMGAAVGLLVISSALLAIAVVLP